VLDKIGKGGGGNNSLWAWLACPILVVYVEPKIVFLEFLAGNSPVRPLLQAFDAAVKNHSDGFVPSTKQSFKTAAPDNLFIVNKDCEKLSEGAAADLHIIVAKTLYVTKRARPDTCLAIVYLTTRVRVPNTLDWEKLFYLV
jgi:hypothetical protein